MKERSFNHHPLTHELSCVSIVRAHQLLSLAPFHPATANQSDSNDSRDRFKMPIARIKLLFSNVWNFVVSVIFLYDFLLIQRVNDGCRVD